MKEHEGNPCRGCPVKEFPAIKSICPCPSYEKHLDALFVEKKDTEPNELLQEIRMDAPSPIMQGKEEHKHAKPVTGSATDWDGVNCE